MGRAQAQELRAHLFALVERVTREGPQGETSERTGAAAVTHLCNIAGLSRASYYRWLAPKTTRRDDAILSDLIQRLALKRRFKGYWRIAKRLREEGLMVNKKRVLRLVR